MFDYFCYTFCHCPYDLANSFNVNVSHGVLHSFAKLFKCFFFSVTVNGIGLKFFVYKMKKNFLYSLSQDSEREF